MASTWGATLFTSCACRHLGTGATTIEADGQGREGGEGGPPERERGKRLESRAEAEAGGGEGRLGGRGSKIEE